MVDVLVLATASKNKGTLTEHVVELLARTVGAPAPGLVFLPPMTTDAPVLGLHGIAISCTNGAPPNHGTNGRRFDPRGTHLARTRHSTYVSNSR